MSKLKYIIFTILLFIFSFSYTYADCTKEELFSLSKEADKIMVTYKHLGAVEVEGGVLEYNHFLITFKNINKDLYIKTIYDEEIKVEDNSSTISFNTETGNYKYYIMSTKCGTSVSEIKVNIPRFNTYSLDPLCKGIDGDDFPLCGKYYNTYIDYDTFETKVTEYRKINKVANFDTNKSNNTTKENKISKITTNIVEFITKYQLYLLITLVVILIILLLLRKRRKRGVLE